MIGKTLGHYEILGSLGAGGMGEVYRARDTTLKREVAIKVLPEDLAADPDRLARLEHEAHLLASLNHPNIATIHSLERSGDTRFLVLELVKGESLEQRLAKGPLPIETALGLGKQIAQALEAAHGESIIHRDLKPANVLITPDGRAKVLDFGLAKAFEADAAETALTQSPTLTVAGTQTGVILGTAPYMSPEQVRGKPLDKRIDIWAFGCVLYEALTSSRAFARETVADTLAAILESDPNWGALPAAAPRTVQTLIKRCLRKDPARRLHDIADARIEIEEALAEPADATRSTSAGATGAAIELPAWRRAIPWVAAGLVVGATLGAVGLWVSLAPAPLEVSDLYMKTEEGWWLSGGDPRENRPNSLRRPSQTAMALSPDGRRLVYNATDGERSQLYLRPMDQDRATAIPDTEGAVGPFFSPDGQSVGFFARAEDGARQLRRVDIDSQEQRILATDVPWDAGASWGDDIIVLALGNRESLYRVSPDGGSPERLTTLSEAGDYAHRWPHILPGSKAVLFTVLTGQGRWDEAEVAVVSLETNVVTTLITDGTYPRYVPTGHLLFARRGALMAVRFDPERLEISGEEQTILEDVMQGIGGDETSRLGNAQYAISDSGTLVYATGGIHPEAQRSLVLVGQDGTVTRPFDVPPSGFQWPRLSPDGTRIAYVRTHGSSGNIYVYDIGGGAPKQLTFGSAFDLSPVWSPDGRWIAFASDRDGIAYNVWRIAADGGEPVRLTSGNRPQQPSLWPREAELLIWASWDIWTLALEGDPPAPTGDPQRRESDESEWGPALSPNGDWIAYAAEISEGQDAIWVRPYPGPGTPSYVTEGGNRLGSPAWSPDGSQIFYAAGVPGNMEKMMVVDVTAGKPVGVARELFDAEPYVFITPNRSYDVDADGNFVMVMKPRPQPQPVTEVHVIINWVERLKERLPTGR